MSIKASNVWQFVYEKTKKLLPAIKLIHVGFVIPPYNGTDFHDHLNHPMLATTSAVPNRQHMIELLKLFANGNDVWMLVEPNGRHTENYFLAKKSSKTRGLKLNLSLCRDRRVPDKNKDSIRVLFPMMLFKHRTIFRQKLSNVL